MSLLLLLMHLGLEYRQGARAIQLLLYGMGRWQHGLRRLGGGLCEGEGLTPVSVVDGGLVGVTQRQRSRASYGHDDFTTCTANRPFISWSSNAATKPMPQQCGQPHAAQQSCKCLLHQHIACVHVSGCGRMLICAEQCVGARECMQNAEHVMNSIYMQMCACKCTWWHMEVALPEMMVLMGVMRQAVDMLMLLMIIIGLKALQMVMQVSDCW